MKGRIKIPLSLYRHMFSALKAQGFGNGNSKVNQISAAEKRNYRDLQPDLKLKNNLDRVFDLKGGDLMK